MYLTDYREETLKDVITVLEGELPLVSCIGSEISCSRVMQCVTRDVWQKVSDKIQDTLESFTVQNLADDYQRKTASAMYCI